MEEGRVIIPSCNSSPGHRLKFSGWKCFYYSFGQTGHGQPGFRECWEAIQPQPTPPPGEATPEQKGSATEFGKRPRRDLSPAWDSEQSYCTNIQGRTVNTACLPGPGTWRYRSGSAASRREGQAASGAVLRAGRGVLAAQGWRPDPAAKKWSGDGSSSARQTGSPWGGEIGDAVGRRKLNQSK